MEMNEYQRLAEITSFQRGITLQKEATEEDDGSFRPSKMTQLIKDRLGHAAMGLAGEASEFMELIKKTLYLDKPLDRERAKKELGDTYWYLAEAAVAMGFTLDEIAQTNIDKLRARYPDGKFDADRSNNRSSGDL